jgi:hypothetical protein
VRRTLRRQALTWLRDDLARFVKMADRSGLAGKKLVREKMQHWRQDTALASVRDPATLSQLSDQERQAWQKLWQEVAAFLVTVDEYTEGK